MKKDKTYAILAVERRYYSPVRAQRKPQRWPPLGFSAPYDANRLVVLFVSVQPFADKVTDYTSSDRDKKRYYIIQHRAHLLSVSRLEKDNVCIIPYINIFRQPFIRIPFRQPHSAVICPSPRLPGYARTRNIIITISNAFLKEGPFFSAFFIISLFVTICLRLVILISGLLMAAYATADKMARVALAAYAPCHFICSSVFSSHANPKDERSTQKQNILKLNKEKSMKTAYKKIRRTPQERAPNLEADIWVY